jgi:hypothetical protein
MSGINGDKARFHRERKQKIQRRRRTRELCWPAASALAQPQETSSGAAPAATSAVKGKGGSR